MTAPSHSAEPAHDLAGLLERVAGRGPAPFLLQGEREVSGAAFAAEVKRAVAGLQGSGFQPGDRLAVYLEKSPECLVALWAAGLAGGLGVPVHPRAKDRQVAHVLQDCAPFGVVTSATKAALLRDPAATLQGYRSWIVEAESAQIPGLEGATPWAALLAAGADGGLGQANATDPAILFYTSGSTGLPKAVIQTHGNLAEGAAIVSGYLQLRPSDVLMAVLPLGFDYGLNQVLAAASCGAIAVLHDHLTAGDLVREIDERNATVLAGVPALWHELALLLERSSDAVRGLGSLRLATNSGGRLEERDAAALMVALPTLQVVRMYGLTEAFRSAWLPHGEAADHPGSFGRAIPGVELLLVDPESGRVVDGPGAGELVHCGSLIAAGYWQRPEETARRFRPDPRPDHCGTAVFSGDLVRRDAEGYLHFQSRLDGMLKVDGHRLAPDEVHGPLLELPGVRALQVVGLAAGAVGHRLVLFVVPDESVGADGAEELRRSLTRGARSRLPAWMVPSEIRLIPQLPSTERGKRDLTALQRLAIEAEAQSP